MRFISRLRRKPKSKSEPNEPHPDAASPFLLPEEIHEAKTLWLKTIQSALFPHEYHVLIHQRPVAKPSALSPLSPFLDSEDLIRARGRLSHADLPAAAKQPIILKAHPLVTLLIEEFHRKSLHGGPQLTLALMRQEFWLLRARATVRAVLYKCVPCTRSRAILATQFMGNLPECPVTSTRRSFEHTSVDYAGPILLRTAPGRGHTSHKAYIAVFICMTTKALHLEIVSDYSSSAFTAAFQRFSSRRGLPTTMFSDNGTTFQGADKELAAAYQAAIRHPDFVNGLATDRIAWRYIPPAAPHFGGLWEAAVRSIKYHLRRSIGSYTLTWEEMATTLCRIKACLNSRPIAAVSDNFDDYSALTPGHFLIGSALLALPEPGVLDLSENRFSRWQLVQRISESFWKSWKTDYFQTLQQRLSGIRNSTSCGSDKWSCSPTLIHRRHIGLSHV